METPENNSRPLLWFAKKRSEDANQTWYRQAKETKRGEKYG